jgi:hypothetical protein
MFRVARWAVFISDHNVYGMGSLLTRGLKQLFRDLRARWLLNQILTVARDFTTPNGTGCFIHSA